MPRFALFDLMRWLHLVCLSVAGGSAAVALLLSGLEEDREDLRGLAAALWKRAAAWGFRLAAATGALLLAFLVIREGQPFQAHYLGLKLALAGLLLGMSELSPRALGQGKRGAPQLAVLLFLLVTFVAVNRQAFGRSAPPPPEVSAGPAE